MMKKKLFIFFSVVLVVFISLPLFNYFVDRYNIFNSISGNYGRYYKNIDTNYSYTYNDRFIPLHYLIHKEHRFDSFIFGSSKINSMNIEELGASWYKVNYNSGLIKEHLHNLNALSRNISIKNVILTLDERTFMGISKSTNENINTLLYPEGIIEALRFYKSYLFKVPTTVDFKMLLKMDYEIRQNRRHYIKTKGNQQPLFKTNKKHIEEMEAIKPYEFKLSDNTIKKTIDIIRKIHTHCVQNNINLKILILPIYAKNLNEYNNIQLNKFKYELLKISNFYDFSLKHLYTNNPMFWKERIHFLPIVNQEILNTLQNKHNLCEKFGLFISKSEDIKNSNKNSFVADEGANCIQSIQNFMLNKEYFE